MRISDWSSDVCSSDLRFRGARAAAAADIRHDHVVALVPFHRADRARERRPVAHDREPELQRRRAAEDVPQVFRPGDRRGRSEEHTSELQSLMRISYAVFCLKKKKQNITKTPRN